MHGLKDKIEILRSMIRSVTARSKQNDSNTYAQIAHRYTLSNMIFSTANNLNDGDTDDYDDKISQIPCTHTHTHIDPQQQRQQMRFDTNMKRMAVVLVHIDLDFDSFSQIHGRARLCARVCAGAYV